MLNVRLGTIPAIRTDSTRWRRPIHMRRTLDALLRILVAAMLAGATLLAAAGVAGAATLRLTTHYPAIVADPGGSARFPLSISASAATTVRLDVASLPPGWKTTFRGGGSIVSAVYVEDSAAQSIDPEVKVPAEAKPDAYAIDVRATDDAGGVATLALEVKVPEDRKSTRLNSSHGYISYALFCLKKKKNKNSRGPASPCVTRFQHTQPFPATS